MCKLTPRIMRHIRETLLNLHERGVEVTHEELAQWLAVNVGNPMHLDTVLWLLANDPGSRAFQNLISDRAEANEGLG